MECSKTSTAPAPKLRSRTLKELYSLFGISSSDCFTKVQIENIVSVLVSSARTAPQSLDGMFPIEAAKSFCNIYSSLPNDKGRDVFITALSGYGTADQPLQSNSQQSERRLPQFRNIEQTNDALVPEYANLFALILSLDGSLLFLSNMRADVLSLMRRSGTAKNFQIKALDRYLRDQLQSVLSPESLKFEQITWSSPAPVLESMLRNEAVHPAASLEEMKQRIAGKNRLSYALFHESMPHNPLVFIYVALTSSIPRSIGPILANVDTVELENPTHAIFYSITSPHRGLAQIDLGNLLIKRAVKELSTPSVSAVTNGYKTSAIGTFATLSPMPTFRKWLTGQLTSSENWLASLIAAETDGSQVWDSVTEALGKVGVSAASILQLLESDSWTKPESDHVRNGIIEPVLMASARRYLLLAKNDLGFSLDPVANFHLRNGAVVLSVNFGGNMGARGLKESFGLMANYLYELPAIEANQLRYSSQNGPIAVAAMPANSKTGSSAVHPSLRPAVSQLLEHSPKTVFMVPLKSHLKFSSDSHIALSSKQEFPSHL